MGPFPLGLSRLGLNCLRDSADPDIYPERKGEIQLAQYRYGSIASLNPVLVIGYCGIFPSDELQAAIMANLPTVRRISREDLRDKNAPKWVDQFLRLLNNFFENVYSALNRNLTFGDNIRTQEKAFTITAGATPTDNTFSFVLGLPVAPTGLWVTKAIETSDSSAPVSGAVYAWWRRESATVFIDSITGLTNGTQYTITVMLK